MELHFCSMSQRMVVQSWRGVSSKYQILARVRLRRETVFQTRRWLVDVLSIPFVR